VDEDQARCESFIISAVKVLGFYFYFCSKYARITLTKYTTFFFFLALVNCIVLIILQAIAFNDNTQASNFIGSLLDQGNITRGLVIVRADQLQYCHDIPAKKYANCTVLSDGTVIGARGLSSVLVSHSIRKGICLF
jgi:hypothetical protein